MLLNIWPAVLFHFLLWAFPINIFNFILLLHFISLTLPFLSFYAPFLNIFQSQLRGLCVWAFFSSLINWLYHSDSIPCKTFFFLFSLDFNVLYKQILACTWKLCKKVWRDLFATLWISDEQLTGWSLNTCPFSREGILQHFIWLCDSSTARFATIAFF